MAAGPLSDIRVVDLTRVWAGPLASRILADLGAEVIKVEAATGRGSAAARSGGLYPDGNPGRRPWNRQGSFNKLNRNKQSIVLDLKKKAGRGLFLQLVAKSDVVIENFSAGTMDDLGLGYTDLASVAPSIVYVAMPGFGTFGPYRDYVAYGPSIEPMTAFPHMFGYGNGPHHTGLALPDATAGTVAASATLTALWRRKSTGEGAYVDVSQYEGFLPFLAGEFLACQQEASYRPQAANRHPDFCPHGIYRRLGEDNWIAIGVRDDKEWGALCALSERGWEHDPRFDPENRRMNEDVLDAAIEAWTATQDHCDLAIQLMNAGIPAAPVLDGKGVVEEANLNARNYFVELDHPDVGRQRYPGTGILIDGQRHVNWTSAATLGEHNAAILHGLLGLSFDDIARLESEGVIADRPPDAAGED